ARRLPAARNPERAAARAPGGRGRTASRSRCQPPIGGAGTVAGLRSPRPPAYAAAGGPAPQPGGPPTTNRREPRDVPRPFRHLMHCLIATAAFTAAGAALAQAPAPTPANPWFAAAPFPEPSEEVLAATANNKLYVFAGLAPGWKPKSLVFEFDPASNQWAKKKPMKLAS